MTGSPKFLGDPSVPFAHAQATPVSRRVPDRDARRNRFQKRRVVPARGSTKTLTRNFRSSITSLSDLLSTLRSDRYRSQRKTRFWPLVRRCQTGFTPARSLSQVLAFTSHRCLPPSPSFLAQSPFCLPLTTETPRTRSLLVGMLNLRVAPSEHCLLYTSPSPRDRTRSRMPSSA